MQLKGPQNILSKEHVTFDPFKLEFWEHFSLALYLNLFSMSLRLYVQSLVALTLNPQLMWICAQICSTIWRAVYYSLINS